MRKEMSHPSRVRELKLHAAALRLGQGESHPSRVRELKHLPLRPLKGVRKSHPSRVRELKHEEAYTSKCDALVAPLAGA